LAAKAALEGLGGWIKDIDPNNFEDPLTGAVKSLSEETAGIIAGRLNAFIINQGDQTVVMRQQLIYQAEIAANTANLVAILFVLNEIRSNSLLSQGIGG